MARVRAAMEASRNVQHQALIIGAGVAGPALALALQRIGMSAAIYEDAPAPRDEIGAFLNLAPNGLMALRALDLQERVAEAGFLNDQLVFANETGRTLARVDVGGLTLMRGALSRILREAASRAGIDIVFGKSLADLDVFDDGVTARFADGTLVTGSMAFGCDGVHSRTRSCAVAADPAPRYTGVLEVGGIVQTDLAATGRAMRLILGRHGVFGYAARANGDTWWFSTYSQPLESSPDAPALPAEEIKAALLERHRGDPPEIREILNSVTSWIGTYPVYELPSLPRWQKGRVCLIGDAAHALGPHVGQGASLALEDALVLSACLRDLGSPDAAFTSYEVLRRARVEPVARHSRRTGRWKAPGGTLARRFRDLVLPAMLRKSARDAQRLYQWSFDWETQRVSASYSAPSASRSALPGPAAQA